MATAPSGGSFPRSAPGSGPEGPSEQFGTPFHESETFISRTWGSTRWSESRGSAMRSGWSNCRISGLAASLNCADGRELDAAHDLPAAALAPKEHLLGVDVLLPVVADLEAQGLDVADSR